ncbi:MAG: tetratricopeptide repeat protein [Faecousia sp.]
MEINYSGPLKRMMELKELAEKKNDERAQFQLAELYIASKNPALLSEAVELYKKSAKQGFTDAKFALGRCYEEGIGVRKNYRGAIQWYKAAEISITNDLFKYPDPVGEADRARLDSLVESGIFDMLMDSIDYGIEPALEAEECIAELGDADAQNSLGCRYYYGKGVEKDIPKAIYWLKKAAEQGCTAAFSHLGDIYEALKDYKEAAKWYRGYAEMRIQWRNERLGW